MTTTPDTAPLALLYVRVSTGRQVTEGHSISSQTAALTAAATARNYRVEIVAEEGRSAKTVKGRPVLRAALDRLDRGEAAALFALDLDRLSRSVSDFAAILDRATRRRWAVVVVGLGGIDTNTAEGALVAHTLAAAAQYERAMTSQRVTRQHAARRDRGEVWGRTSGPRSPLPAEVRARIIAARAAGDSLRTIAATLTAEQVPTATGGRWHASTVQAVLRSPLTAAA